MDCMEDDLKRLKEKVIQCANKQETEAKIEKVENESKSQNETISELKQLIF